MKILNNIHDEDVFTHMSNLTNIYCFIKETRCPRIYKSTNN